MDGCFILVVMEEIIDFQWAICVSSQMDYIKGTFLFILSNPPIFQLLIFDACRGCYLFSALSISSFSPVNCVYLCFLPYVSFHMPLVSISLKCSFCCWISLRGIPLYLFDSFSQQWFDSL